MVALTRGLGDEGRGDEVHLVVEVGKERAHTKCDVGEPAAPAKFSERHAVNVDGWAACPVHAKTNEPVEAAPNPDQDPVVTQVEHVRTREKLAVFCV
ncbi:MAG: hypothetical protein COC22_07260 [Flavobacteriaceae bacterium]|nr:MAG: hypothetical protein COC22_07260 [Flavobacteriaceae bacterium]